MFLHLSRRVFSASNGLSQRSRQVCLLRARAMMSTKASVVPEIDLGGVSPSADHQARVAKEIGQACEEIGFLSVHNHGVSEEVIDNFWNVTTNYFDLDESAKKRIAMTEEYPYGYCGFAEENLTRGYDKTESKPDLKECFAMGPYNPEAGMPPVQFPGEIPELRAAWMAYYQEMEKLSSRLLRLFAVALELPPEWFVDACSRHRSALRALNYPVQEMPPLPGQIRAGAHTDYGTLTILKQDSAGGLQVKSRAGEWCDVPYMPNAYVINLGDAMPRWTNDRWVSTLHRVINPPEGKNNRRQSAAFFHNINHDHILECIPTCTSAANPPKYPPIKFWDHLMDKHLASTK